MIIISKVALLWIVFDAKSKKLLITLKLDRNTFQIICEISTKIQVVKMIILSIFALLSDFNTHSIQRGGIM